MATKIVTKNSSTASAVPTASDLVQGELAVNVADKRLFTEDNGGAIVELGTNPSGDVTFQDNGKAIFGAGSDLQIYHDGSHSYISDVGAGDLILQAGNDLILRQPDGSTEYLRANEGAGVQIYHNGSQKFLTTSTGIDVTGTATMDGLTVDGTAFVNLTSRPTGVPATAGALWSAQTETGNYGIVSRASSTDSFTYIGNTGSAATLGTSYGSSGSYLPLDLQTSDKKRLSIAANGDISFYEDTGTTAKLFWDASAESLGIGTSSPSHLLSLYKFQDDTPIRLQGSAGSYYITNNYSSDALTFTHNSTERMRIDSSGNVGIGTSSPTDALVVEGDVASPQRIKVSNTNASGKTTLAFTQGTTVKSWLEFDNATSIFEVWQYTNNDLRFGTNNTERMRIDSSGNVQVKGGNELRVYRGDNATYGSMKYLTGSGGLQLNDKNGDGISFVQADCATEYARIDSSGNLLVGTTNATHYGTSNTTGSTLFGNGTSAHTTNGSTTAIFNRISSDGEILQFRKDGTTVGSIGAGSGDLNINGPANHSGIRFQASSILPRLNGADTDGTVDLGYDDGTSTHRWKDLYLSGGVYLGGTGAANKLDDYETGTWTPEIVGSTTAGSYSSTIKVGTYTKVGQVVSVWGYFLGSSGTGAGDLDISGLPFTIASDAVGVIQGNAGLVYPSGTTDACLYGSGGTTLSVRCNKSDGTSYSRMAYPTSATYIRFTLSYKTT